MMRLLQASGTGVCPVTPGADMEMAMTLIQISVLGIPLLLALFQFVNDHVYEEREDHLTLQTQFFGGAMILGSYLLLAMYYAGLCTINSTLPPSPLTITVSLFIVPLFVIITGTLYAQYKQMVKPGFRFAAWMASIAVASGYFALFVYIGGGSFQIVVTALGFTLLFSGLGAIGYTSQYQSVSKKICNWATGIQSRSPSNEDEIEWRGIQ